MRQAGAIPNEADAKRFIDYLLTQGIEAKAEAGGDSHAIWILDELHLARGKEELQAFLKNPQDSRYAGVEKQAEAVRRETQARYRAINRNIINVRHRWASPGMHGRRPVTFVLIAICVGIGFLTNFGEDQKSIEPYLYMTAMRPPAYSDAEFRQLYEQAIAQNPGREQEALAELALPYDVSLPEIRHGQLWRLVTPILPHQSFLHLLFNMWWLFLLGGMIEDRFGSWWLILLVLVTAVISNLAQYFWDGPNFGGMSGVVYALFGYVWMKSRFDPMAGLYIGERDVFLMIVWFVVCFTGWIGPIANGAHAGGLIAGMIIGYAPRLLRR